MRPSLPTTKVSGTPYTPQSIEARPLLSAPTADGNYIFGLFTAFLNISYVLDVFEIGRASCRERV